MARYAVYNLHLLRTVVSQEHPDWSSDRVSEFAERLRRELHRLNRAWLRSQERFRNVELVGLIKR